MKRLALVAAILAVAACSKNETPATDTASPAMAPAPAAVDSAAAAMADSARRAESTRVADSVAAATKTKTKGKSP